MELSQLILANLLVVLACAVIAWLWSVFKRNVNLIDTCWGLGFVVIAWLSWFLSESPSDRSTLVVVLVSAWGVRLAGYLTYRNHGKPEDYRYAAMREKHGSRFPVRSLPWFR